ncbi:hypothetical protein [Pedobacter sp. FW305-3-2-15-E-R2A2]|uniref:hypothetical protein n=1 Tax=Pedobacter sp. FW305-3-2-15-E-R2A2 TaxID=3140251 RepID=UPI003140A92E
MATDIKSKITGAWMLQKEFQSPWKTVIAPLFFDFDKKAENVMIRGYSDKSVSKYSCHFNDVNLKIGNYINFYIIELSNEKLILKISENEYKYYRLKEKSQVLNEKELQKVLVNSKWMMDGNILEFTSEPVSINNSFKMIEYQDSKKFFGSYSFDMFKNNLFLLLLIDGKPMELVFKIIEEKGSILELQTAEGNILDLTKQI